jgi:hypothetical protein
MWLLLILSLGLESRGMDSDIASEDSESLEMSPRKRRHYLQQQASLLRETARPSTPLDAYKGHYRRNFGWKATARRMEQKQGECNFNAALRLMDFNYERIEDERDAIAIAENLLVSAPLYGCSAAYVPQAQLLMRPLLIQYSHLPHEEQVEKLNEEQHWKSAKLLLKLAINEGKRQPMETKLLGSAHLTLSYWYRHGNNLIYKQKEKIHLQLANEYGVCLPAHLMETFTDKKEDTEEGPQLFHVPHLEAEMDFWMQYLNPPAAPEEDLFDFLKAPTMNQKNDLTLPSPIDTNSHGSSELMGFMGLL